MSFFKYRIAQLEAQIAQGIALYQACKTELETINPSIYSSQGWNVRSAMVAASNQTAITLVYKKELEAKIKGQ